MVPPGHRAPPVLWEEVKDQAVYWGQVLFSGTQKWVEGQG